MNEKITLSHRIKIKFMEWLKLNILLLQVKYYLMSIIYCDSYDYHKLNNFCDAIIKKDYQEKRYKQKYLTIKN